MALSYIGKNEASANTVTIPAHKPGDLIVIFAVRNGSTTPPTVPSPFASAGANTGTTCAVIVGWKRATSNNDVSGTWTNADKLIVHVYRGALVTATPIVRHAGANGTGTTVNYSGIVTMTDAGNSWGLRFAFISTANTNLQNAPTAFTNRSNVSATTEAAGHDTNGAVSSVSFASVSVGGTSGNWVTQTIEILAQTSALAYPQVLESVQGVMDDNISITIPSGLTDAVLVATGGVHQGTINGMGLDDGLGGDTQLTQVDVGATAFDEQAAIYYLANPTPGTYTLYLDYSGGSGPAVGYYIISNAKQTAPSIHNNADSDSSTAACSVTPTVDNSLVIDSEYSEPVPTMQNNGQSNAYTLQGASYENHASSFIQQTTAGAKSMGYGLSYGGRWAMAVAVIEPPAAGGTDTNDERSAVLTGKDAANSSRGAVLTGKDTANASRGAVVTGKETANDSRGAVLTGKDTTSDTRGAVITGKETANDARGAILTGTDVANDARNAVLTGSDAAADSRGARLTGLGGSNDERGATLLGTDTANDSRGAVITGYDTAQDSRGAILTGQDSANDSRSATLTGSDSANATRGAVLTGKDNAADSRGAVLTGITGSNDERGAVLTGIDSTFDTRNAKITGKDTATDERGARIIGVDSIASEINAHLWGMITTFDERGVRLTGFAIAYSERGAKITGKLNRGRPTVLPPTFGGTIIGSRNSRTTLPGQTPTIL